MLRYGPATSNADVMTFVRKGGCLERPVNCPSMFYELIQQCWVESPRDRPSFTELGTTLPQQYKVMSSEISPEEFEDGYLLFGDVSTA